jgi:hypothetical protein
VDVLSNIGSKVLKRFQVSRDVQLFFWTKEVLQRLGFGIIGSGSFWLESTAMAVAAASFRLQDLCFASDVLRSRHTGIRLRR